MKIRKYCFKFIDNTQRVCVDIDVNVYCDKPHEWENEFNIEKHAEWMKQHIIWEHKLKMEVINKIKSASKQLSQTQTQSQSQEANGHHFGGFKFCKEIMKKECEIVNTNVEGNGIPTFRQIKLMEVRVLEFEKGQKPQNWINILTEYRKFNEIFNYYLSNIENEEIELFQVAEPFVIPPETYELENASMVKNVFSSVNLNPSKTSKTSQTIQVPQTFMKGGNDYEEKYLKYKKKYVDLKQKRH